METHPQVTAEQKYRNANEVFQSAEAIHQLVEHNLDTGIYTVEPSSEPDAQVVYVPVQAEDVNFKSPEDEKNLYGFSADEAQTRIKPGAFDRVLTDEVQRVKNEVELSVGSEAWWLKESAIEEDIKNGKLTQLAELTIGDQKIPVANFSESIVSEELLDLYAKDIQKAGQLTNGAAQRIIKAIVIQNQNKFGEDKTMGSTRTGTGIIRLSGNMYNGTFDEDFQKFKAKHAELGYQHMSEITLIHEIGHLVQGDSESESLYNADTQKWADATGWDERQISTVDDYGNEEKNAVNKRGLPSFQSVKKQADGSYEEVSIKEIAATDEIMAAKPVTGYGEVNSKEDFAEAFPVFAKAPEKLDSIRRNATQYIVDHMRTTGETGEANVNMLDIDQVSFAVSNQPQHFKMNVKYGVQNKSIQKPETWQQTAHIETATVTDDFGNQIDAKRLRPTVHKTSFY